MQLKYVGDLPQVSGKGVSFDKTHPDKYTYLNAAVELLEALSYGETEETNHLYRPPEKERNSEELLELLKKYCGNIDTVFAEREEKTNALIEDLVKRVNDNSVISAEERSAWLKNIDMMRDYYLQYVTNESAYDCALSALADEVYRAKVKQLTIPMMRNYGTVLHDLRYVLEHHRPPIDMVSEVKEKDGKIVGIVTFRH